jgi:peptidoglycan DL-endopeptidase CwlO
MRASRDQNLCRTLASGLLALATACASSRSEQREAPPPEAAAIPVAETTIAPPAVEERPAGRPPTEPAPPDPVSRTLSAARAELGKRGGREGVDCSTFVQRAYAAGGVDLYADASPRDNGVQAIRRYVYLHGRLHRRRAPAPGDLVFFDNSYDRNRNRLLDDRLTHVGIVEDLLADGTILVLHSTNHGVVREPMNLRRPHALTGPGGEPINAPLRRRTAHDTPRTPHLMSELFAGFGTVFGAEPVKQRAARRPARSSRRR